MVTPVTVPLVNVHAEVRAPSPWSVIIPDTVPEYLDGIEQKRVRGGLLVRDNLVSAVNSRRAGRSRSEGAVCRMQNQIRSAPT